MELKLKLHDGTICTWFVDQDQDEILRLLDQHFDDYQSRLYVSPWAEKPKP